MTSPPTTSTERLRRRALALLPVLATLGVLAAALGASDYIVTIVGFAAIDALFVVGLNFFMGYTGQVSFGQNAFACIGGYGSAILCANYGWQPVSALLVSMLFSCAIAAVIGYPTLKLSGHYLAMATFALGLITYEISVEWIGLTQGYMGISGIPPLGAGAWSLGTDRQQLVVLVLVMLAGIGIAVRLRHSRFGRALSAIAGSEAAARALGINVARYKLAAFVIAAAYASAAGSLFAHFVGFISPEVFGNSMVIATFTMLYLGGIGTTWGPALGALIVSVLPELLRGLHEMQDVTYTAILIAILIFAPKGIVGMIAGLGQRRRAPRAIAPQGAE